VLSPERQGFILTRNWRDTPAGVELEYWLATDSGPLKVLLTAQKSVAFVEARHREAVEAQLPPLAGVELRELGLKSFQQEPVLGIYARSFRQLRRLARTLQQLGIPLLEADVRPHERYLMERFITAGVTLQGGRTEHAALVNCKLVPAPDFRPVLKVVSLDIETSQHQDLYSIALDGMAERVVFMLGEPPAKPVRTPGFELIHCTTRKAMIDRLNDWFARNDPDVIIGWNVIQFDLRVLQKTADECATPLLLGASASPLHGELIPANKAICLLPCQDELSLTGLKRSGPRSGASRPSASRTSRKSFWAKARTSETSTTRWRKSSGATS
jgi:DNA polymerase-2